MTCGSVSLPAPLCILQLSYNITQYSPTPRTMFTDKVVLITGASSGIGAACALAFAKSSATLSLVGRNLDNLSTIGKVCEKLNHIKPLLIVADVTSDTDLDKIVEDTANKYGKIDVLINNAGINSVPETHSSAETYDRVMATNVRATYLLTTKRHRTY
ncbi:unnamed protein product [Spodoptera littoralis]|uniref:Uncharacterized protein n=1 Tax=Spodoptera littoralis TaxID=7109 RepID=A0A9P0N2G5_SPOLI|nr:unnamed protein product [Spodoptera littoralis]CAH1639172.1 unnamed protein product [Spodoptera littoralis]